MTGRPGADGAGLELDGLRKRFGSTVAVDGVDLVAREGEFLTLLGPSGCGKTTVLRLVAGFEEADGGRVRFGGRDVTGWPPRRRGFGMVFQNYALFPHLSVGENVAFGLEARGEARGAVAGRVERALERVDLPGFGDRRVQDLSGGQQQRVALARALAVEPPLLLLDEPLSNLDAALRERTRTELRRLLKELGITALYVTHDQEEAFDVSDRIAVMRAGRLLQAGTPEELYDRPADPFVATFVGRANLLAGEVSRGPGGRLAVRVGEDALWPLPEPADGRGPGLAPGAPVEVVVRPEGLEFGSEGLPGVVRDRRFRGAVTSYQVEIERGPTLEVVAGRDDAASGVRVRVRPRAEARLHAFPAGPEAAGPAAGPSEPRGEPGEDARASREAR